MESKKRWIFLIGLEVWISIVLFIRSYFWPQYYAYILLPQGRWMYFLCSFISICFSVIYLIIITVGRRKLSKKIFHFIEAYTTILLLVGFLKTSPDSGYTGLDKVFVRLLYYLTEPLLDFWNYLSSLFPTEYRNMIFIGIVVGYCLLAGNIVINYYESVRENRLNILFSYSYITYIFCHRVYLSNRLNLVKMLMGIIYVLAWIIMIIKMRNIKNVLKKFQIFWLSNLSIVIIAIICELPQFAFNRFIGLIRGLSILKAFSWPLFMLEQVPYIAKALIYLALLIYINILCFIYIINRKNKIDRCP